MNDLPVNANYSTDQGFSLLQKIAETLSRSTLVPKAFQENKSNCIIAIEMAQRLKVNPFMVMQNLNVINGKPTWSSQYLIASFNTCGRFLPIHYEFVGEKGKDSYGCYAYATEILSNTVVKSATVTIAMAKAEGWYGRSGSKWVNMPDLMLQYRAAAFLVRTYAPEITMGMQTQEEVIDTTFTTVTVNEHKDTIKGIMRGDKFELPESQDLSSVQEELLPDLILCEECGLPILEHEKLGSSKEVAEYTQKNYGKKLCDQCAIKEKNKTLEME